VTTPLYGLLAAFDSPEAVLAAARQVRADGYRQVEAFTPFPVDGLAELVGLEDNPVAVLTFFGGLAGGALGYFMQWYSAVELFPLNVGGRAPHSWPAFIPITFELTILGAAVTALASMFWLNGLPRPHHPVFGAGGFGMATRDRFFLCVRATDPHFEPARTRSFLEGLAPRLVEEVPDA
jgi:hypothetical protein